MVSMVSMVGMVGMVGILSMVSMVGMVGMVSHSRPGPGPGVRYSDSVNLDFLTMYQ
jgi:hypothetical protein